MAEVAPEDPRSNSSVPALGSLPKVSSLGEGIVRVVAPNPSYMTLDGTNTYLLSDSRAGAAVIIDPGPISDIHFSNMRQILETSDVEPAMILLTHHHLDHSEAARSWSDALGIEVSAMSADLVHRGGRLLAEGDSINLGETTLRTVATPGHTSDHLSFISSGGYLFTGDHVLGRSTSVISYPDGSLGDYLGSLEKIKGLDPVAILPGHGPEMVGNLSGEVIDFYIAHRRWRISQVVDKIRELPSCDLRQLTLSIYAQEIDDHLFPAALQSVAATVRYLVDRGIISSDLMDKLSY